MTEPLLRGHIIFCDDIRHEEGGKISYMGVYGGVMFVNGDFPFLLPKFGIAINYMERRDASLTDEVIVRMFMPGENEDSPPSFEAALPAQQARETVVPHPDTDLTAPRYLNLVTNLIFSPFLIHQKGTLRIRVHVGAEKLRAGSLLITNAPPESGPVT